MITCICPTKNRADLIPLTIQSFLNQTYLDSELLIMDDSMEALKLEILNHSRIKYVRLPRGRTLLTGQLRNMCCETARGDVIAHMDSDDWYHPLYLQEQIERLISGIEVVGYNLAQFWDMDKKRAFELRTGECALGASQVYLKSFWRKHHFRPQKFKEDVHFSDDAERAGVLKMTSGIGRLVVRRHARNTWGAKTKIDNNPKAWQDIRPEDLPKEFWEDLKTCL